MRSGFSAAVILIAGLFVFFAFLIGVMLLKTADSTSPLVPLLGKYKAFHEKCANTGFLSTECAGAILWGG